MKTIVDLKIYLNIENIYFMMFVLVNKELISKMFKN